MLKRRTGALAVGLLLGLWASLLALSASADEPNRAGLAILFEDGRLVTRCVQFPGEEITGADLLAASGLQLIIDSSRGLGITVCKVEGLGCDYPAETCFCQCMGKGPCRYWNYFYRDPGDAEWTYSPLGALLRKAGAGSVDAWVWGDGHTPPDLALAFETACLPPAPSPSPALAALSPSPALAVPSPSPAQPAPSSGADAPTGSPATASPALAPSAVPAAASPTPVEGVPEPQPAQPPPSPSIYWPFGVLLLALIGVGAYLRLGRRS
jgi:hypothetical protein